MTRLGYIGALSVATGALAVHLYGPSLARLMSAAADPAPGRTSKASASGSSTPNVPASSASLADKLSAAALAHSGPRLLQHVELLNRSSPRYGLRVAEVPQAPADVVRNPRDAWPSGCPVEVRAIFSGQDGAASAILAPIGFDGASGDGVLVKPGQRLSTPHGSVTLSYIPKKRPNQRTARSVLIRFEGARRRCSMFAVPHSSLPNSNR